MKKINNAILSCAIVLMMGFLVLAFLSEKGLAYDDRAYEKAEWFTSLPNLAQSEIRGIVDLNSAGVDAKLTKEEDFDPDHIRTFLINLLNSPDYENYNYKTFLLEELIEEDQKDMPSGTNVDLESLPAAEAQTQTDYITAATESEWVTSIEDENEKDWLSRTITNLRQVYSEFNPESVDDVRDKLIEFLIEDEGFEQEAAAIFLTHALRGYDKADSEIREKAITKIAESRDDRLMYVIKKELIDSIEGREGQIHYTKSEWYLTLKRMEEDAGIDDPEVKLATKIDTYLKKEYDSQELLRMDEKQVKAIV
ncbi:MAG TPA: hypothetical protein ENN46_01460, partial [Candidatus Woesearchaeota archaeon]|nr:hypothetical protein [Candidatus Woesearchaeota archaeon]